jgi:hypothetical protein
MARFVNTFFHELNDPKRLDAFVEKNVEEGLPALCDALACYFYVVVPYFAYRSLLRGGGDSTGQRVLVDGVDKQPLLLFLGYWLPLMIATNAHNYSLLIFRYLCMHAMMLPDVSNLMLRSVSFSLTGRQHSAQEIDLLTEGVRCVVVLFAIC